MAKKFELWDLEDHTKAKHEILRGYLNAWIPIMGLSQKQCFYVDGFCGPGRYKGGEDGSPLIALKIAIEMQKHVKGRVVFGFFDQDKQTIEHLNSEIERLEIPDKFVVKTEQAECREKLETLLRSLKKDKWADTPVFAFIDPFGFSGIPYQLINELLSHRKTEVFINFMVESINRFLDNPDVTHHIVETFGTEECLLLKTEEGVTSDGRSLRIKKLSELYGVQLKKAARFVRGFEIRGEKNKTRYFLYFASNNEKGFVRMKEAMWSVDRSGKFIFSLSDDQLNILNQPEIRVAELLRMRFGKKNQIAGVALRQFVEQETDYLNSHKNEALIYLEGRNEITVDAMKTDRKKRTKNTFPDTCIVNFK